MVKPPSIKSHQPAQLNKLVIVITVAVAAFLLIFAIVNAFKTSPKTSSITTPLTANQTTVKTLAPIFKDLPSGYGDTNAIKKYANQDGTANLEQELAALKNQYNSLQQQLMNTLQQVSQSPQHANTDTQTSQARSSGLLFNNANDPSSFKSSDTTLYPTTNNPSAANATDAALGAPVTQQQAAIFSKQRMEAQKLAVIKAADSPEEIYDLHNMVKPISPYEIQAGTIIPAVLITGINTTLAGVVVAQVKQNIFDTVTGQHLLIPKGSKVLGEYDTRVAYGDRRVLITFNRIIRPDGSSILLGKPMASDYQGQSGIEGNVDNHWWRILGAATLSTILSVGIGVASDRSTIANANYPSAKQGAILGGAGGIAQAGQSIVSRALDVRPTITLPPGYQFNIIVKKDMVLTPYA